MGRYATEPDNATKSAKAKGSNLRVHFKVQKSIFTYIPRNALGLCGQDGSLGGPPIRKPSFEIFRPGT